MDVYKLEEPEGRNNLVGVGPPEEAGTQQGGKLQE